MENKAEKNGIDNSPYKDLLLEINRLRKKITQFADPWKIAEAEAQDVDHGEFLDNLYEAEAFLGKVVNCDYISKLITGKTLRERREQEAWEQN